MNGFSKFEQSSQYPENNFNRSVWSSSENPNNHIHFCYYLYTRHVNDKKLLYVQTDVLYVKYFFKNFRRMDLVWKLYGNSNKVTSIKNLLEKTITNFCYTCCSLKQKEIQRQNGVQDKLLLGAPVNHQKVKNKKKKETYMKIPRNTINYT